MEHTAFAHLPSAFFEVAPELTRLEWPREERATCHDCAVGAPEGQTDRLRPMRADVRCCTYHPTHPNWLVGRALRRGGPAERAVDKRMTCMDDGVSVVGIGPSAALKRAWKSFEDPWLMFGQLPEYLCPYFNRETLGCNVWQDRGAICRTWFCKHTDGTRGRELWAFTRRVLKSVERRLAAWCIVHGDPPDEHAWEDREVLRAWYIRCADLVDAMSVDDARGLRDALLLKRLEDLGDAHARHLPPLPSILGPSVGWVKPAPDGDGYLACADSGLDMVRLRPDVFQLLSRLDGRTPWPEAVAAANEVIDGPPFDEQLLLTLFRRGLLQERDPDEPDPPAGVSSTRSRLLPYDAEDKLW